MILGTVRTQNGKETGISVGLAGKDPLNNKPDTFPKLLNQHQFSLVLRKISSGLCFTQD